MLKGDPALLILTVINNDNSNEGFQNLMEMIKNSYLIITENKKMLTVLYRFSLPPPLDKNIWSIAAE